MVDTSGIKPVFDSFRRRCQRCAYRRRQGSPHAVAWIASAARRRAARLTGSMSCSSSLSRTGTGFARRPDLPATPPIDRPSCGGACRPSPAARLQDRKANQLGPMRASCAPVLPRLRRFPAASSGDWHASHKPTTQPKSAANARTSTPNGGGEIRTLGTPIRRTTVFETAAFNRSATPPGRRSKG